MPLGIRFFDSILILGILSVLLIVLVLLVLLTLVILLVLVILIVLLIVLLIVVLHGFLHFSVGKSIRKQSSPTEYDCHSPPVRGGQQSLFSLNATFIHLHL